MFTLIAGRDEYTEKDSLKLMSFWFGGTQISKSSILTCKIALFNEAPPVAKILVPGPSLKENST